MKSTVAKFPSFVIPQCFELAAHKLININTFFVASHSRRQIIHESTLIYATLSEWEIMFRCKLISLFFWIFYHISPSLQSGSGFYLFQNLQKLRVRANGLVSPISAVSTLDCITQCVPFGMVGATYKLSEGQCFCYKMEHLSSLHPENDSNYASVICYVS